MLVILGLLVGGVLTGQSLIHASELRAATSEYQRYSTAVNAFKDKYFALPGDMTNAESFWGTAHAVNATCQVTAASGTATCNGDGNGSVNVYSTRTMELFRFWQHLANAGLIEGRYSGTSTLIWDATRGTNSPASKYPNGGWAVIAATDAASIGGWYSYMFPPASVTHWLELGAYTSNALFPAALLSSEDAWNIDTKMDDGFPGRGRVTTFNQTQNPNCASSSTASSATYQLSSSGTACAMLIGF